MKQIAKLTPSRCSALAAIVLALCLLASAVEVLAQGLRCAFCGKSIPSSSSYVRSGQNAFCSDACFNSWVDRNAKKCVVCGRPVTNGYTKDGKAYCSLECVSTTFPKCVVCGRNSAKGVLVEGDSSKFICQDCAGKPKCFACGLPGDVSRLPDGRFICSSCGKGAVYESPDAMRIFNSTRALLRDKLGLSTNHPISVELIGLDKLKSLSSTSPGGGMEMGLFSYSGAVITRVTGETDSAGNLRKVNESSRKVDELWAIYALYGLPSGRLAEVFAHELAHDWMQEFCPNIKDVKTKEGWAEYIAWRANALFGQPALNARIERCSDPIYGDGFKAIKRIADRDGYDGLRLYLRKLSASREPSK